MGFIHFTLVYVLVITLHLDTELGFPSGTFINSLSPWRSFELKVLSVVVIRHRLIEIIPGISFIPLLQNGHPLQLMNCFGIGLLLGHFNALFIIWEKTHLFPSCDTVIY